jgi:hypothetical protein
MKIYREPKPEPVDEWNDNWNPDKRPKPDLPDKPEEIITSPESVLYPTRQPPEPVKPIATKQDQIVALQERLADPPDYDEHKTYKVRLDNLIEALTLDWLDGETDEEMIFKNRSKVVKRFMRHIAQNYNKELAYRRPYNFPLDWMPNVKPIIAQAMQFHYDRQRSLDAPLMQALENQNQVWINGKKYQHEKSGILYPFATFMTNSEFYADFGRCLITRGGEAPSEDYMQRIITAFKKAKIIVQLCGSKRTGFIVADGYYTEYSDRWIKRLFLKNTPEFKKALQEMVI